MMKAFMQIAVGLRPLPKDGKTLSAFLYWAGRGHILGQVAAAHKGEASGKLADILENARIRTAHDQRMLTFEAERISRALLGSGVQPILLKGAAYMALGLRAGQGRRVSDIDILVEEQELAEVETLLKKAGWQGEAATASDYDQDYYRQWMHELPPMRHKKRRTLIDVHHRLLPRTARLQPRHELMAARAKPIENNSLRTFDATDRFIHSAIHIFADGAFETPARSFMELYYLFDDLSADEEAGLVARAAEVNALRPVAGALWAVSHYFGEPKAHAVLRSMGVMGMSWSLRQTVRLWVRGGALKPLAGFLLYLRSHYLRMPLGMLAKHLIIKTFRRKRQAKEVGQAH
ncbi:nucleotidyltransferase domain-containing protein [Kordiimonas gwangyangensis]|uniref:nucleotidyltransferase domain-containing protein n=1 Tax=Kordiimonas gwangyangensis TaxID=288022 RepID=UPI00037E07DD|nr:nucleotidyltransferase family protein [Kordiimonas gwangyangensis]